MKKFNSFTSFKETLSNKHIQRLAVTQGESVILISVTLIEKLWKYEV